MSDYRAALENQIKGERKFGRTEIPVLDIEKAKLVEVLQTLQSEFDFIHLEIMTSRSIENRLVVSYLLENVDRTESVCIQTDVSLNRGRGLPSVQSIWKSAEPFEEELIQDFKIEVEGAEVQHLNFGSVPVSSTNLNNGSETDHAL